MPLERKLAPCGWRCPHHRPTLPSVEPNQENPGRERELRKEGREVPSRVRLREGPIGVRITLGQPTIG